MSAGLTFFKKIQSCSVIFFFIFFLLAVRGSANVIVDKVFLLRSLTPASHVKGWTAWRALECMRCAAQLSRTKPISRPPIHDWAGAAPW